jgi:PAS domain S-box-containing protein
MVSVPVSGADAPESDLVLQHRAALPLPTTAAAVVGMLLVAALWPSLDAARLLAWLALAALAGSYIAWVHRAHRHELAPGSRDTAWRRHYLAASALRGLSWGVCCAMLWPSGDAVSQSLIIVALLVVGAITLASLAFDPLAAVLFALPLLAPLAWHQWQARDPRAAAMLAMLLVLGASIHRLARQSLERARQLEALRRSDAAHLLAAERAAQGLREAEQIAGMGSFDWDLVSGTVRWSDHHFRLWGLAPGSAVPDKRLFLSAIHEDDRARVADELRAALAAGRRTHLEYRVVLPDGQVRTMRDQGEVYLDRDGRVARLSGIVHDVTEQRQAEESLRLVEFAMNTIADPVGVIDSQLRYRLVNKAWCEVNELSPEQVLGRTLEEIYPTPVSLDRRNAVKSCIETGLETKVRGSSPSPATLGRILETRYFPFNEPDVSWHGAVMISRDVTIETQSQAALEASLVNLRLTLNSTGDAILATDADARDAPVLFVNDQWLDLWHMPRVPASQVTAEFIIEYSGPFFADPDRQVARIVEIIASGQPADDRLELVDGRVLLRRCRIANQGRRQVRVWGFRDITAETRALQLMQNAEAKQRALLDAFPGHIAASDENLNLVYVNARFAELVGETPERLLGANIASRLNPEEAEILRAEVAQAMSGKPVTAERHLPATPDRPAIDMLVTRVGGVGIDNTPICYSFATDITELNRMQRELLAAKNEAERANRAKSLFLSNMSHELRTPLNAVLGFGQLLQLNLSGNLSAKQVRQATEIMNAGQHLLLLINDLLDLARVESGRLPVSLEPVDLAELLQECTVLVEPIAQRDAIDIEITPIDRSFANLVVIADRTRLKQVVLNLLSNAVKYNLPHGRVTLRCEQRPTGRLRLLV